MSQRADRRSALIIGLGGIESGCSDWVAGACRSLRDEGWRVLLAEADPESVLRCRGLADTCYPGAAEAVAAELRPELVLAADGLYQWSGPPVVPARADADGELVVCFDGTEVLVAGTVEALGTERLLVAPAPSADERELKKLELLGVTALREAGAPPGGYAIGFGRDGDGGPVFRGVGGLNPRSASIAAAASGFPLVDVVVRLVLGRRLGELRELLPLPRESAPHTLVRLGEAVAAGTGPDAARQRVSPDPRPAGTRWDTGELTAERLRRAKAAGLSDEEIARLRGLRPDTVRELRHALGVLPGFPALGGSTTRFACYQDDSVPPPRSVPAVLVVGARPATVPRVPGLETVVLSDCPALVGAADRGYLTACTAEEVLDIVRAESLAGPIAGVLLQLGGERARQLLPPLRAAGIPLTGTPPATQASAGQGSAELGLLRRDSAKRDSVRRDSAVGVAVPSLGEPPVGAVEVEVTALYDGEDIFLAGVSEYVERTSARPGPRSLGWPVRTLNELALRETTGAVARRLGSRGLVSARYAIAGDRVWTLVAVAGDLPSFAFTGVCGGLRLADAAARVALGASIEQLRAEGLLPAGPGEPPRFSAVLRPHARSGVPVMGTSAHFAGAFGEAMAAAHSALPGGGQLLVSEVDGDRRELALPLHVLAERGFTVLATEAPAAILRRYGLAVRQVPDTAVAGLLAQGLVHLLVDTRAEHRVTAARRGIPVLPTICELTAAVRAIEAQNARGVARPIPEFPAGGRTSCADDVPGGPSASLLTLQGGSR